jgi:hypothetical protein
MGVLTLTLELSLEKFSLPIAFEVSVRCLVDLFYWQFTRLKLWIACDSSTFPTMTEVERVHQSKSRQELTGAHSFPQQL